MTKPFRDALLEQLEARGWKMKYVAEQAGVSYEQLKKLSQGKSQSTNVDDAIKIAHVFGMTLDELVQDTTAQDREEVARLWLQLSEAERDLLRAAARGRSAEARAEG